MTHYVVLSQCAQKEYEAERQAVDEIMRKIDEEDAADAAKRTAQQAATREYIANFLKQQVRRPGRPFYHVRQLVQRGTRLSRRS